MAYTPELSQVGSATLRRLAWHLGLPMTKTLEIVLKQTFEADNGKFKNLKNGQVCKSCKDKSICEFCPFQPK